MIFWFLVYSFLVQQDKMVFGTLILIAVLSFQLLSRTWSIVYFVLCFRFGLPNGCFKPPEHHLVCSHSHHANAESWNSRNHWTSPIDRSKRAER